jgi:hypothetical protein
VLGDPNAEPIAIFPQLFERMRRSLARKHIEDGERAQIAKSGDSWIVSGHIEWDEEEHGRVPQLIVDGKRYSWIRSAACS